MNYTQEIMTFAEMDLIRIYGEELRDALKWMDERDMGETMRRIIAGTLRAMLKVVEELGALPDVEITSDAWKAFAGPKTQTGVATSVFEVHRGRTNANRSNPFRPRGGLKEVSKRYVWNKKRFYAKMEKLTKMKKPGA